MDSTIATLEDLVELECLEIRSEWVQDKFRGAHPKQVVLWTDTHPTVNLLHILLDVQALDVCCACSALAPQSVIVAVQCTLQHSELDPMIDNAEQLVPLPHLQRVETFSIDASTKQITEAWHSNLVKTAWQQNMVCLLARPYLRWAPEAPLACGSQKTCQPHSDPTGRNTPPPRPPWSKI